MVTGEQVQIAMMAADIKMVEHHECGACGCIVYYFREGEQLYFNPSCGCSETNSEPRTWKSAAEWINMQQEEEWKRKIARRFGFSETETL